MKHVCMTAFLAFFVIISNVNSQNPEWVNYSNGDNITDLTEEENLIWVTTSGGLVKIDKTNDKTTFFNRSNSELPTNNLRKIVVDKNGIKWMCSTFYDTKMPGLIKYDGINCESFTKNNSDIPSDNVYDLAVDKNNNLWICTDSGLVKFDGMNWVIYDTNNSKLPWNHIDLISVDSNGNVWIGIGKYLISFDGMNWTSNELKNLAFPDDYIHSFTLDRNNNIWIGSGRNYLIKFNNNNWTVIDSFNSHYPYNSLNSMSSDNNNNIWIGTSDEGLLKYDGKNWTIFNKDNSELPDNSINCLFIDKNDCKWIGVWEKGLIKFDDTNWIKYNTSNSDLSGNYINKIIFENDSTIWFGLGHPIHTWTSNGVMKYNFKDWISYNMYNSPLPENKVFDIVIDKHGNKWIGTFNGLAKFDNMNWEIFDTSNSILNFNHIQALCVSDDDLWIGITSLAGFKDGAYKYNNNNWTYYPGRGFEDIKSISVDSTNNIWYSCFAVLSKFDGTNWIQYHTYDFDLPLIDFYAMTVDKNNNIWVSSGFDREGLFEFDGKEFELYNSNNSGLPSNCNIRALCMDNNNNLWIGSDSGLVKYDGTNWTIFNIENSRLPVNEVSAIAIDKYDNKWLGTASGGLAVFREGGVILDVKAEQEPIAKELILSKTFPNPFQYTTNIEYTLPHAGNITIKIYDTQGQLVRDLFSCSIDAGKHTATWDGRTDAGNEAPNGVYMYRIQFEGQAIAGKMVVVK